MEGEDEESEPKLVNGKGQYKTLWASRAGRRNLKEGYLKETAGSFHLPHTLAKEKAWPNQYIWI